MSAAARWREFAGPHSCRWSALTILRNTQHAVNVKIAVENAKNIPDGVQVFLFGSACYRDQPNDIDLLIIYDSDIMSAESAYAELLPLLADIRAITVIPVRPVILSDQEARDSHFIEDVEPIELRSTRNPDRHQV